MRIRWWPALVAALSTPWIGPHVDGDLPLGWLLLRAVADALDSGFWVIAGGLFGLAYAVRLGVLTGIAARTDRRRRAKDTNA